MPMVARGVGLIWAEHEVPQLVTAPSEDKAVDLHLKIWSSGAGAEEPRESSVRSGFVDSVQVVRAAIPIAMAIDLGGIEPTTDRIWAVLSRQREFKLGGDRQMIDP